MNSSLSKNNVAKSGSRRLIDNVRGWMYTIMPPYYCRYKYQLQGAGSDNLYQVMNTMFYVLGLFRGMRKFIQNMGFKNT